MPLDYIKSMDVLYPGSKIRNFADRTRPRYPHELVNLGFFDERTLIYLDTFAQVVVSSLFACMQKSKESAKKKKAADGRRRRMQRWTENILASC